MISWSLAGTKALELLQIVWKPLLMMSGGVVLAHIIWYGPQIDRKNLKIALVEEQNSSLKATVKSQNVAIENASKVAQKTFDDMLEQLSKELDRDDDITKDLLKKILEAGTPVGCTETTAYLLEQLDNLQWENDNE